MKVISKEKIIEDFNVALKESGLTIEDLRNDELRNEFVFDFVDSYVTYYSDCIKVFELFDLDYGIELVKDQLGTDSINSLTIATVLLQDFILEYLNETLEEEQK